MDSNKENHVEQGEDAPTERLSVASPRISSVGASEDPAGNTRHAEQFHQANATYELTSGHDHLHWGGVGRRVPQDARSIASSVATRDDKSIYEEPGPLDVTEEVEEHDDEQDAVEQDEEEPEGEPEEITLTQVQDGLQGMALHAEPSTVGSTLTGISEGGSLAEVVDQLADQAVAGELSPRQAAAAIRSATQGAAGNGIDGTTAALPNGLCGSPEGTMKLSGDERSLTTLSKNQQQQQQQQQQQRLAAWGANSREEMETVLLDAQPSATSAAGQDPSAAQRTAHLGTPAEQASFSDADEAGAVGGVAGAAAEPPSLAEAEEEASAAAQAAMLTAAAPPAVLAESGVQGPASIAMGRAGGVATVPGEPPAPSYQSRMMQQLASSTSEDDITVYTTEESGAPQDAARMPQPDILPSSDSGSGGVSAASNPARMQPLSIDASQRQAADATAALAAIDAVGRGSAVAQQSQQSQQEPGVAQTQAGALFPPSWYQTFKGLLYMDGVDALGRPVVVLNADAVPPNMKSSALVFIKAHLEPMVNQGDYVLVFTSGGMAKLPSMWIMGAYRTLPRPFRKNVQYIVLVRPSAFLRTVLAFMRPFVSKKAGRKIKQVHSVHEIAEATAGEVTVQSLGVAFAADHLAHEAGTGSAGDGAP